MAGEWCGQGEQFTAKRCKYSREQDLPISKVEVKRYYKHKTSMLLALLIKLFNSLDLYDTT